MATWDYPIQFPGLKFKQMTAAESRRLCDDIARVKGKEVRYIMPLWVILLNYSPFPNGTALMIQPRLSHISTTMRSRRRDLGLSGNKLLGRTFLLRKPF